MPEGDSKKRNCCRQQNAGIGWFLWLVAVGATPECNPTAIQGGRLPVINGVITPINDLINGQLGL